MTKPNPDNREQLHEHEVTQTIGSGTREGGDTRRAWRSREKNLNLKWIMLHHAIHRASEARTVAIPAVTSGSPCPSMASCRVVPKDVSTFLTCKGL